MVVVKRGGKSKSDGPKYHDLQTQDLEQVVTKINATFGSRALIKMGDTGVI